MKKKEKGQQQGLNKKDLKTLSFEISFYEGIIKENPNFLDALKVLGNAYTRYGLYEKGLKIDLRLIKLRPMDPITHYNLACSYSLLGNVEQALISLEKSLKLGYSDMKFIKQDPDLENLRRNGQFSQLISKYI